jgi:hypothetical protein
MDDSDKPQRPGSLMPRSAGDRSSTLIFLRLTLHHRASRVFILSQCGERPERQDECFRLFTPLAFLPVAMALLRVRLSAADHTMARTGKRIGG